MRRLMGMHREGLKDLHCVLVHLKKYVYKVSREGLW